jgi:arylsulfatase A-like enzyme
MVTVSCIAVLGAALLGGLPDTEPGTGGAQVRDGRPNVVILLADDLGYGDLGCYGHPTIRTPNLDRMAIEGMKLTQFYSAASVCTPSRAALLTGRLPVRSGLTSVLFPFSRSGLPSGEITIAEALKSRGYQTMCAGKWHLGHEPQFLPNRHGFDRFLGVPYSHDMTIPGNGQMVTLPLLRDENVIELRVDPATLTERYTNAAIGFLQEHGKAGSHRGTPFFLYVAYSSPHTPLASGPAQKGRSARGPYGDSVEEMDTSVGRLFQALRDNALDSNTLVVFTSDNGPWLLQATDGGSAGLLREGKGSTWEGGMREPCLVWWPVVVSPGRVSSDIACTMDWFVTVLQLAGAAVPSDRPIDGLSLVPLLKGTGPSPRTVMPYFAGTSLAAIRKGPWKLHLMSRDANSANPLRMLPRSHAVPLLFHLEHDPSELYDVACRHPDVLAELVAEADRLQREVTHETAMATAETRATTIANSGRNVQVSGELSQNNSQPGRGIVSRK